MGITLNSQEKEPKNDSGADSRAGSITALLSTFGNQFITILATSLTLSAFCDPCSPLKCGFHIWKPQITKWDYAHGTLGFIKETKLSAHRVYKELPGHAAVKHIVRAKNERSFWPSLSFFSLSFLPSFAASSFLSRCPELYLTVIDDVAEVDLPSFLLSLPLLFNPAPTALASHHSPGPAEV